MKNIKTETERTPDWVFETPWEVHYSLSMTYDTQDTDKVDLTREEFIALKHAIARIRGYDLARPAGSEQGGISANSLEWTLPERPAQLVRRA